MKPRIFIGIPTFNRPRYLRETIASVLAQSRGDWRAVVSDNASEPAAADEVRNLVLSLGDDRIAHVLQPENGGEYGQGRFFFGATRDEDYFVILHDDDRLCPDYLEAAVRLLDRRPDLAYFHSTPRVIDAEGRESLELTRWYVDYHGHTGVAEGEIVILDRLLSTGFTPICGTVFRLARLRETGLVDADLHGNYPFELNVLLRLGERGLRAWYSNVPGLEFRLHSGALRSADRLMQNEAVVDTMIALLERRRFSGANERRRRVLLGRLFRARSILELQAGRYDRARSALRTALGFNRASVRGLALAPGVFLAPKLLTRILPPQRSIACPPGLARSLAHPQISAH